jgi:hypothetical protein
VKQKIGLISEGRLATNSSMMPLHLSSGPTSRTFQDLHELLDHLFASARNSVQASCSRSPSATHLLIALERYADIAVAALPPSTRRIALAHDGLHPASLLVDRETGVISGVVDWDVLTALPRCLAAQYPSWLRYDGVYDPRFAAAGTEWMETREEITRLNVLFERVSVRIHA